jgi:hypothetical protein
MWRIGTLAGGWALVLVGAVMLLLPGPGLLVILGGLALLGRESAWARRVDLRLRALFRLHRRQGGPSHTPAPCGGAAGASPATPCPPPPADGERR